MVAAGLPDFGPVQHNLSYNATAGTTRGLHAEPWDKLVSVAHGQVFGAWVDLRQGPTFGTSFSLQISPQRAIFVPRGVANGYQALESDTVYSYLVNAHWSPTARASYTYLNVADETVGIPWPIPWSAATVSSADRSHPRLAEVTPMRPRGTIILGASGQVGRALTRLLPDAVPLTSTDLDLTDADAVTAYRWADVGTIINAAAFTAVDEAETSTGRERAWALNVTAVERLVRIAQRHHATLVHISSDYVFDGTRPEHTEDEPAAPLNVYGATKAAADALVSTAHKHYLIRTSWVIGEGKNFVRTMARLAANGIDPAVVDDQTGRLTFTEDLAEGIVHLLTTNAPFGTYNLTNEGPPTSWCTLARRVYALTGHAEERVQAVTTNAYAVGRNLARRPRFSTLSLDKIQAAGFQPRDAESALVTYLQGWETGSDGAEG